MTRIGTTTTKATTCPKPSRVKLGYVSRHAYPIHPLISWENAQKTKIGREEKEGEKEEEDEGEAKERKSRTRPWIVGLNRRAKDYVLSQN